jgi:hypothetical protein
MGYAGLHLGGFWWEPGFEAGVWAGRTMGCKPS